MWVSNETERRIVEWANKHAEGKPEIPSNK